MKNSITVVCPNYNDSRFFINWLDKVTAQNPDEIIICDDHSSDGSIHILHALQKKYNFKVVVSNKRGAFNAFMEGVNASTSNYIMCSACDDEPIPGYFDKMKKAILDYPFVDLYICGAAVLREGRRYERKLFQFDSYVSPEYMSKIIKNGHSKQVNMSAPVIKKDAILRCVENSNEHKANMDCLMNFYTIFDKGFIYLKDVLYLYRSYPTSFGASGHLKDIDAANKFQIDFFSKHLSPSAFKIFIDSGLCQGREAILPYIALRTIMKLPKWARRKFYNYFYSYDWRIEKL